MERLPFDQPVRPAERETPSPLTVTQLCGRMKRALAEAFPSKVRVVGEVSNFTGGRRAGGNWFFSLKDGSATIRCVCFASVAARVRFEMQDGMEVVATGRVDMYPAQGSVQLYVDDLEPVGAGALELALRRMVQELRGLGYFDPARKKALPAMARRVAVVTSRGAAALQDVIDTAAKRWAGCQLLLYDVRVQGAEAAPQIAEALRRLSNHGAALGIDAIILTRGGGSMEDLWAFNERQVADAVFACALPVVAAIGHETDTTVAELVADLRCATPTQAAMALVPDRAALEHQVSQAHDRLGLLVRQRLRHGRQRLASAARHPLLTRPTRLVEKARERVDQLAARLAVLPARRLAAAADRLDRRARHLEAIGPRQVLGRGYTYTLGPDGRPLRSAASVRDGDRITTVLLDGELASTVGPPGAEVPSPAPAVRAVVRRRRPRSADPGQSGLFDRP